MRFALDKKLRQGPFEILPSTLHARSARLSYGDLVLARDARLDYTMTMGASTHAQSPGMKRIRHVDARLQLSGTCAGPVDRRRRQRFPGLRQRPQRRAHRRRPVARQWRAGARRSPRLVRAHGHARRPARSASAAAAGACHGPGQRRRRARAGAAARRQQRLHRCRPAGRATRAAAHQRAAAGAPDLRHHRPALAFPHAGMDESRCCRPTAGCAWTGKPMSTRCCACARVGSSPAVAPTSPARRSRPTCSTPC